MKNMIALVALLSVLTVSCQETQNQDKADKTVFPETVVAQNLAQNPEGIEFNKKDNTFLLSSLNAGPIVKVNLDGTYAPFTSGEAYPMSTAGLEIDYKRNRLLVAALNGMELYDNDPATKGISNLRIYNLETGVLEHDINLSSLVPDAPAYMANDIAVDGEGNAYLTDWYAGVVYKVDLEGNTSVFWKNETGIPSGPNGIDFHPDGYLLVSILVVNEKGLYADYGLVKVPVNDASAAQVVNFTNTGFTGFDGMVMLENGNVVGVTNNGETPGGNTLLELSSSDNWTTASVVNNKTIAASTTVAVTPGGMNYVINQDFMNPAAEAWTIEHIKF